MCFCNKGIVSFLALLSPKNNLIYFKSKYYISQSFIQQNNYLIVKYFIFIKDEDIQNKKILCFSNL